MPRILHVIHGLTPFGGTPRKLLCLARTLDPRALAQAVLVHGRDMGLAEQFVAAGCPVIQLTRPGYDPRLVSDIVSLVRSEQVDVLCLHFQRALVYGMCAAKLLRLPAIYFLHADPHIGLARYPVRFAVRLAAQRATTLVANSLATARSATSLFRRNDIRVVYNPVSPRAQCRVPAERSTRADFRVVHVGAMIPLRDQSTLLEAIAILARSRPSPNLHLDLIGDGVLRGGLTDRARELGVADYVHFRGRQDDVGKYLSAADCYVNPAVNEGFGIAVVEAMLAGLPVVVAAAGAHVEIVRDGEGLLYPPGDAKQLASRLAWIMDHRQEAASLGLAAARSASARFAPSLYARSIREVVEGVL